jgi:hypothetical protein
MYSAQDIQEHKLTILSTLGLNIQGCFTKRDIAKRILPWLRADEQRMYNFINYSANRWVTQLFESGDATELFMHGLKGIDNFDENDWIDEIESYLYGDHIDLISVLKAMTSEEEI